MTSIQPSLPLTARTRALMTPELLEAPLDTGTVAQGLDAQVRFRLRGSGPTSQRELVPDSRRAAELLESGAGPRFRQIMQDVLETTDVHGDRARIRGIALAPDADAAAAGSLLAQLDASTPAERATFDAAAAVPASIDDARAAVGLAAGWHEDGWITLAPDYSRALLTGVGAYTPGDGDVGLRSAGAWARELPHTLTHELQHAVTPPGRAGRLTWMEEGTANLMAGAESIVNGTPGKIPLTRHSYAGHLGAPDHYDPGWSAWTPPAASHEQPVEGGAQTEAEAEAKVQAHYHDSQGTLLALAGLAGVDVRSPGGFGELRELLQGSAVRYVPGRIADRIIERHGLDPAVREPLRARVIAANDSPEAVERIRADFLAP